MRTLLPFVFVIIAVMSCQVENDAIEYPPLEYSYNFEDREAGFFKSLRSTDGAYQFIIEFNDRGRGPHLEETIYLTDEGVIDSLEIRGHNYIKDTVNETFTIKNGQAIWESAAEEGREKADEDRFFIGLNSSFGNTELLVNKMLESPGQSVKLYPSGQAKINSVEEYEFMDTLRLTLIEYTGVELTPKYIWLDENHRFFAVTSSWYNCIRKGYESLAPELLELQAEKEEVFYQNLANELTQQPEGKFMIENVNLFNPKQGELVNQQTVVVNGDTIERILSEDDEKPEVSRIINGKGRTLLPGLIDMHTHILKMNGLVHLGCGVTSVRDMGNTPELPQIRKEFDENKILGPRILITSGFIDQDGKYAGNIGKKITALEEGYEAIEFYKNKGYDQIKLYSSIDPEWVKPLAEKAHQLGMKVCGHIPAFMLAEKAVADGFDEIQHINMIALNFMPDTIDTRTPLRFSMVGQHAHSIDIEGDDFREFIQLLKEEDIVVDPTVSLFEGMFTGKAGEAYPQFEPVVDRLPIQLKRKFYSGGLPIPEGEEEQYKKSFDKLLDIIYALYQSGITLVPGTDASIPVYVLHAELENYVKAGIPESEVLKMATLTSAEVAGVSHMLGTIEEGKLADMILVNGNPLEDISDIRRVDLTIKDGNIYDCAKLYKAYGISEYK